MTQIAMAVQIAQRAAQRGWKAFIVGGWVRDRVLGVCSKDIDMEVFGPTSIDELAEFAETFASVERVGRSFAVLKVKVPGHTAIDLALPRTEQKVGIGHRGFTVMADSALSPERASMRRDFTFNAMFFDPLSWKIIDFHRGQLDLEDRTLAHVGPRFSEDPLRVLRGMQFCGRFDLTARRDTVALCRTLKDEFHTLPVERVREEWHKLMTRSIKPSRGLVFLHRTGWLDFFPPLSDLLGLPQDARHHPEGSVWTHTLLCLDRACALGGDEATLFAALLHDIGKPTTTVVDGSHITSRAHDTVGAGIAFDWMLSIGAPHTLADTVSSLVREHMVFTHRTPVTDRAVRRLSDRLTPATLSQLLTLIRADLTSRGSLRHDLSFLDDAARIAKAQHVLDAQPQPLVKGRHLISLGLKPGRHFAPILDDAFDAQLDGAFATVEDGIQYVQKHLLPKGERHE